MCSAIQTSGDGESRAPRVTVMIATYNRPEYLQQAVKSALGQTYEDILVRVIDDGSVTDTRAALKGFSDSRLCLEAHASNLGIARTMREAFASVETEYFVLFGDDDELQPEFVEKCVQALDSHGQAAVAGTLAALIDAQGEFVGFPEAGDPHPGGLLEADDFVRLYFSQKPDARLYIGSMLFRRAVLDESKVEYPEAGFARCSDDLFLARLAATSHPIVLVRERLCRRRVHPQMNSAASPAVVDELMTAAEFGAADLASTPFVRDAFVRFVLQSGLQATRDMPREEAFRSYHRIRETASKLSMSWRQVTSGWSALRVLEFSSSLALLLVRRTQPARLAVRRALVRKHQ